MKVIAEVNQHHADWIIKEILGK